MSEQERAARNEDEPGRTFEAERAQARQEESPEVEGQRFFGPSSDYFYGAEGETEQRRA